MIPPRGLTVIPSQSTGDERFCVNPNAAKARGNHQGEDQNDDVNDAPNIWAVAFRRRRAIFIGIVVQPIEHVGRSGMRAEGEVVDASKVCGMHPALSARDREKGALKESSDSRHRGQKGDFLARRPVMVCQGARAMDLVGKFGGATFSTSAGSRRRSFRVFTRHWRRVGDGRKGVLGSVSWRKPDGGMNAVPPCTIFGWLVGVNVDIRTASSDLPIFTSSVWLCRDSTCSDPPDILLLGAYSDVASIPRGHFISIPFHAARSRAVPDEARCWLVGWLECFFNLPGPAPARCCRGHGAEGTGWLGRTKLFPARRSHPVFADLC